MQLTELLHKAGVNMPDTRWESEVEILRVSTHSADVQPGDLFVYSAPSVASVDKIKIHLEEALSRGAAAVIAAPHLAAYIDGRVPFISTITPHIALSQTCGVMYAGQQPEVVAVTGTNGKTSVAHFTFQLWRALGESCGVLGTLGLQTTHPDLLHEETGYTTPDAVTLHRALARCAELGIRFVSLEASSHGLDQRRLDGVRLKAAAYTSFSHDHLDYHVNESAYFSAKIRLFCTLLPADGTIVVNRDARHAPQVMIQSSIRQMAMISVGRDEGGICLRSAVPAGMGQDVVVTYQGQTYAFHVPLIGVFQVENALLAAGLVMATGFSFEDVVRVIPQLQPVPGRMQHIAPDQVFVDYAHTPDALERALQALRPYTKGKLWVIFGCGGDRDALKRSLMGQAAAQYSDRIIITDDNPRYENPQTIRQHIAVGCGRAYVVDDRHRAIKFAIEHKADEDTVLIAGKGHEKFQIIGNQKIPFDDAAIAQEVVNSGVKIRLSVEL